MTSMRNRTIAALVFVALSSGCAGNVNRGAVIALNFTVPGEMPEDGTKTLTCTADATNHPDGLMSLAIFQQHGTGVLAPDSNPALKTVARDYSPVAGGKSRTASFTCQAQAGNGEGFSTPRDVIVRDAQNPTWNPAAPVLPLAGADGNPPGKVGVDFAITVDAKDNGAAGLRGAESGIYQMIVGGGGARLVVDPAVHTTNGRPSGPPGSQAGPLDESKTFKLKCTEQGDVTISVSVSDTAGNVVMETLPIECYP